MGGSWRIRHKLMLGLGLVVAIIALLLVGTVKGLAGLLDKTKTIESKLQELQLAYKLQQNLTDLAASCKSEDPAEKEAEENRGTPPKFKSIQEIKSEIKTNLAAAKSALADYDKQLRDTLDRGRDPDKGYNETEIVSHLWADLEQFETAINNAFDADNPDYAFKAESSSGEDKDKSARSKTKHYTLALDGIVTNFQGRPVELLKGIYGSLNSSTGMARSQYLQSMWIVGTTSVVGVLLMTGLLRFFYGWVFYPIRDLEKGAGRVAQGDFEHRIEVHSGDEMEDLAAAFNNMTTRLREMYRDLARQVNERSRQLVRSERLAGVGFLAAGVAHEINNPLASIAFCSEALETRLADLMHPKSGPAAMVMKLQGGSENPHEWEVVAKYLKMIQDEAFRCKDITERLLEFSRTGERRREPMDLAELIQSVLDMVQHLQNRRGKDIVFQPNAAVNAWVNVQEIKSVVLNLIVNALDSMEEGGTLTITLRPHHDMAEMVFTDTGCGMTGEVLENIFEPFFTKSRTGKGTGLGLTITHRIITQHGGEIEASSPGVHQGSTFIVRLPLRAIEEPERNQDSSGRLPKTETRHSQEEARDNPAGLGRREAA